MDPEAQLELARGLQPGEALIWFGRPRQGFALRASDALFIPFSLLWGGFAIFWEIMVVTMGAPFFFSLWGIPFVLVGLYMIIGRFFVDARIRANTIYGLTNQRAIIISGFVAKKTTSLPLTKLTSISVRERRDGLGTVELVRTPARFGEWVGPQWPRIGLYPGSFEFITDARRVHDQILQAQRAAA